ncbi:MAG: DUF2336 domain-containing protein [Micavibrio sp.]|nr:MAG: DUF2336 domain-containing protein [Micavibrio sp.]
MDIVLQEKKQKEPKVDAKRLLGYARAKDEDSYALLTREIAEIYNDAELSDIERQIANDVLLLLLQQAELDLRVALSERLSLQENVPLDLVLRLAHDEIAVAAHVLLKSKSLSDLDLEALVQDKGPQHWRTIARRENISSYVAASLIETGDIETAVTLVDNLTATLSAENMRDLSYIALRSRKLHMPLMRRPEVSNEIALSLYLFVSQNLRREILDAYNIDRDLLDKTLEGLLEELHNGRHKPWDVTDEMRNLAAAFAEREEITTGLLTRTLRRGQMPFFVALLGAWIGAEPEVLKKMIERDPAKAFAIVCRALGIVKSEFATLYLLSGPVHSQGTNVDQSNLLKIIGFFDNLPVEDAKKVVNSWKKTFAENEELAAGETA